MNQQQILFGLVSGATLSASGAYLATSGLADWSLCVVGLGLSAIALVSRAQVGASDTGQMRAIKLEANASASAE